MATRPPSTVVTDRRAAANVLQAVGVTVDRGGVRLLQDVHLQLRSGDVALCTGPNGSGKTTLLRTVAGLQPPVSGAVHVEPESLVYAGHADGIKATLTVTENLNFWAQVFGRKDISPALKAFDLDPLAARAAGMLSAGQKRRLGLARLLVTGRPIWVLDEPTVSLDRDAVAMFARAVGVHLAGGGSALLATHIELGLEEAETLELAPYRARAAEADDFDEAFL